MAVPLWFIERKPFAVRCKQHDEVPVQDMNMEISVAFDQAVEEVTEGNRPAIGFRIPYEFQPAVDVPSHDQYGTSCAFYCFPESTKKIGPIDDKSGLIRV